MIIVRSPLRFSYFGGGTDIREYYKRDYGCVLGEAINKYVYVIVNRRFENDIRLSYMKNEIVPNINKVKHSLIRESLKTFNIKKNIEIVTIADIPGTGTGLGSSSSLSVGLCNALSLFRDVSLKRNDIAKIACDIEIKKAKKPIGKQDQYFATYGGVSFIKFEKDEKVKIERLNLSNNTRKELDENLIAFYTGIPRKSSTVLSKQIKNTKKNLPKLDLIRSIAEEGRDYLKNNDLISFSELFNKTWELKKTLSSNISNSKIESIYKKAINSGAIGGKLSGAGNGGFLFFYCEPKFQNKVRKSLRNLYELKFGIDDVGTIRLH